MSTLAELSFQDILEAVDTEQLTEVQSALLLLQMAKPASRSLVWVTELFLEHVVEDLEDEVFSTVEKINKNPEAMPVEEYDFFLGMVFGLRLTLKLLLEEREKTRDALRRALNRQKQH